MGTRKKKPEQAAPPRLEGRTPKESAANLRKEAQRISEYRNKPEVQRAIARNPALLQSLLEMEKIAAKFRIMANWLEQELGDVNIHTAKAGGFRRSASKDTQSPGLAYTASIL